MRLQVAGDAVEVLCAVMCGGANLHPDAARAFADGICSARVHQPLLALIAAQPHTATAVKVGGSPPLSPPQLAPSTPT